jgi:hypothetical protein
VNRPGGHSAAASCYVQCTVPAAIVAGHCDRTTARDALRQYLYDLERQLDRAIMTVPIGEPGRKLRNRMLANRPHLFVFMTRRDVPFTNNASERNLRPSVIFRKVTNCLRCEWGPETCAALSAGSSAPPRPRVPRFTTHPVRTVCQTKRRGDGRSGVSNYVATTASFAGGERACEHESRALWRAHHAAVQRKIPRCLVDAEYGIITRICTHPRSTPMRPTRRSDRGTACRAGRRTARAMGWRRRWTQSASTVRTSSPLSTCTSTTPRGDGDVR